MPGVYEVADASRTTIYIGQSARDVPTRLRQHLSSGSCVAQQAAFWRWTYSSIPKTEEAAHLARYRQVHGMLPPCNRAAPLVRDAERRLRERMGTG